MSMEITQNINTHVKLFAEGFQQGAKKVQQSTQQVSKYSQQAQFSMRQLGVGMQDFSSQFGQHAAKAGLNAQQLGMSMKDFGSQTQVACGKVGASTKQTTRSMGGFRFEMLSVMFFGMMLQRVFGGMLQPIAEVYGIFDLFKWVMVDLTLNLMDSFYDDILNLTEAITNLDPKIKDVLASIILFGLIIGTIAAYFGAIDLGLTGLGRAIATIKASPLGPIVTTLANAVKGLGWGLAIVMIILYALYKAWEENWMGMKRYVDWIFEGIGKIIEGALLVIESLFGILFSVLDGDLDGVLLHVSNLVGGIIFIIYGIVKTILGVGMSLKLATWRLIASIFQLILSLGYNIIDWVIGLGADMGWWGRDAGDKFIMGIVQAIKGAAHFVRDALQGIINGLPEPMRWIFDQMWAAGKGAVDWVGGLTNKGSSGGSSGGGSSSRRSNRNRSSSSGPNYSSYVNPYSGYSSGSSGSSGGGQSVWYGPGDPRNNVTKGVGESSLNITNNFYGHTMDDLTKNLDDRDKKLLDELWKGVPV